MYENSLHIKSVRKNYIFTLLHSTDCGFTRLLNSAPQRVNHNMRPTENLYTFPFDPIHIIIDVYFHACTSVACCCTFSKQNKRNIKPNLTTNVKCYGIVSFLNMTCSNMTDSLGLSSGLSSKQRITRSVTSTVRLPGMMGGEVAIAI